MLFYVTMVDMENMTYTETEAARLWDSERRSSPYSTVADPDDESYCEGCDSEVVYADENDTVGRCKCDGGRP